MTNRFSRWLRLGAALFLAAALPALGQLPVVPGEPAQPSKAAPAPRLRIAEEVAAQPGLRATVQLSPVTDRELAAVQRANGGANALRSNAKRAVIGIVREPDATPPLPSAADLAWVAVQGGQAAQMAITSPQAAALRVSIDLAGVPGDVEMVFFGSADPSRLVGPVRVADVLDRTSPWWSPVTEGEAQTVELFVPGPGDPRSLALRAAGVSHLFAGPASGFAKRVQDIGMAGSCNVDLPCSSLQSDAAFQNVSAAVAQMVFTDGSFTVLCSGTLLNDTDAATQVPWFYSANHCFDNESPPYKTPAQMQAVANTLDTLWLFQANACNSGVPVSGYRELPTGATYIYSDAATDVLFLRLNGTPPPGAFYAGWDANPVSAGTGVVAVHHPQGDLKKVSQGSVLGFTTPSAPPASGGVNKYIQVRWSSGTTEPGSSGGGIFTRSGSQYVLRGGLWGGGASCTTPTAPDIFSRFDQAYPALAAYLSPANAPAANFTDLWWNPNESGWGLNLVQHSSHLIFGVWYTYAANGARTWFAMPTGTWTDSSTYTGPLYATSGPAAGGTFDPSQVTTTQVGTATLHFTDANNGTWSYSVNGVSGVKFITRQPY
jgi:hypothetical protein